ASRLGGTSDWTIWLRDGDRRRVVAYRGQMSRIWDGTTVPLDRTTPGSVAMLEGRTVTALDVLEMEDEYPGLFPRVRDTGLRSVLSAPMMRQGEAIGTITVNREEARAYSEAERRLLETFADQAVIAIENARLFSELQER